MWRAIDDKYFLSEIVAKDKAAYLEHFQEKDIHDWTLRIPFPYTEKDADEWIRFASEQKARLGITLNWAIREPEGKLIGGVGFTEFKPGESHMTEIGYWLAKPYWGKGIMTKAVQRMCEVGFGEYELVRIVAPIFAENVRSARVLEKCGFTLEGTLRCHYLKNGELRDGKLYARIENVIP